MKIIMRKLLAMVLVMILLSADIAVIAEEVSTITLPSSLQIIEDEAFMGDVSIGEIVVPDGTIEIRSRAFAESTVSRIYLPDSLTFIARSAFDGCEDFFAVVNRGSYGESYCQNNDIDYKYYGEEEETPAEYFVTEQLSDTTVEITDYIGTDMTVVIPAVINGKKVTSIGEKAFYNVDITSLVIPEGVTSLSSYALNQCGELTSVSLPEGLTNIGSYAFNNCYNLKEIEFPSTLKKIGKSAFYACPLKSIDIPDSVTEIGQGAFNGCGQAKTITIGQNVASIGKSAFSGCGAYESLVVPGKIATISENAFANCQSLKILIIEDGIQLIDRYAFYMCSKLTSVYIPESVTEIWGNAFYSHPSNMVIYGIAGSYAETYAAEQGIDFCAYIPSVDADTEDSTSIISGYVLTEKEMGVEGVFVRLINRDDSDAIIETTTTQSDGYWELQHTVGTNCALEFVSPYYTFDYEYIDFTVQEENDRFINTAYFKSGDDSSTIKASLQESEIVVGSEAVFNVSLADGNTIMLIVDGVAYEQYFAEDGDFTIKRVFTKAGTRNIVFQAGTDGVWGGLSETLTLNVTSQGTLDMPEFVLDSAYCVNQPLSLTWNGVENAENYTVYAYINGINVYKESTSETSITIPSEALPFIGALSIEVIATGYGYSQAGFGALSEIVNKDLSITFAEMQVEVGSEQSISIYAPGAAGVRYQVYGPDGGLIDKVYAAMSEETLVVSITDIVAGTYSVTAYAFADGFNDHYAECTVTFDGINWIKPSLVNWKAEIADASTSIGVEASFEWDVLSAPDWISAQRVDDELILSIVEASSAALSDIVLIGDDAVSCEIFVQSPDYAQKPDINYPESDGLTLEQAETSVSWNSVEGAEEYLLSLRDLTTDTLLLKHVSVDTCVYNIPAALLLNGHEYRLAIGARLNVNENIITSWAERLFAISADGGCTLSGQLFYSDGTSATNHLVCLMIGETLIESTVSNEVGHWSFDGLASGASYTVVVGDMNTQEDITKTVLMNQENMICDDVVFSYTSEIVNEFCGIVNIEYEESVQVVEVDYDIGSVVDIICDADWLNVDIVDNEEETILNFVATENEGDVSRETTVILISDGKNYEYSVIQDSSYNKVYTEYLAASSLSIGGPFVEYKNGKWSNAKSKDGMQYYDKYFTLDTTPSGFWSSLMGLTGKAYVEDSLTLKNTAEAAPITIIGDLYVRNKLTIKANTHVKIKGNVYIEKGGSLELDDASSSLTITGNLKYSSKTASNLDAGEIHVSGNIDLNKFFDASDGNILYLDGKGQKISYKKGEDGTEFATIILEHALAALDNPSKLLDASIELIQFGSGGKKYTISTEDDHVYTNGSLSNNKEDLAIINTLFAMRYNELDMMQFGWEYAINSSIASRDYTVFITDSNGRLSQRQVSFGITDAWTAAQNIGSWTAIYNGDYYTMDTTDYTEEMMEIYNNLVKTAYDNCKALLKAGFSGTAHNLAIVYLGQAYALATETFDCRYILTLYDACRENAQMIDSYIEND